MFGIVIDPIPLIAIGMFLLAVAGSFIYIFVIEPIIGWFKHRVGGLSKYQYKRIPSFGDIPVWFEWHKCDADAMTNYKGGRADFIERVYPSQKHLKPRKK